MAPLKILFTLPTAPDAVVPGLERLTAAGFAVERILGDRMLTEEELIGRLPGVSATIAGGEPYTERVFASAPGLRLVARHGVGYELVDVAAATRHGVLVTTTPGSNAEAVADLALALMGAVRRQLVRHDRVIRAGGWGADVVPGLWRATVGIVGLGQIGRRVARRCRGFEMCILATEPAPDRAVLREHDIELVGIEELLRRSDIVTLHLPASPGGRPLLDRARLALMKPTAILINTARGALVDEQALHEALAAGRLWGAGLDVFRREPPAGSPLLGLENVVLTPHAAGKDLAAHAATVARCVESILRLFRGESPGAPDMRNPEVLGRSGCA